MASFTLLSTGSNARGQLGIGSFRDVHKFTPCVFLSTAPGSIPSHIVGIEQIACGGNHTLALLQRHDGKRELWGCGDGSRGQLGPDRIPEAGEEELNAALFRRLDVRLEDTTALSNAFDEYNIRLIAAGWETTYVVLSCPNHSDVLLSMGANDYGNLGVGPTTGDTKHMIFAVDLRHALTQSFGILNVLSLSAGPHHTVVHVRLRDSDGSCVTGIIGWGASRHGQLGPLLNSSARPSPTCSIPTSISLPARTDCCASIAIGRHHTVCLLASGKLVGIGSDRKGQLDALNTLTDVEQIGCTWSGTYALLRSGIVVATGSNTHSQLGHGLGSQSAAPLQPQPQPQPVAFSIHSSSEPQRIVSLVCGSEHVLCAVEASPSLPGGQHGPQKEVEVWGWGWNEHGNLGTGGTADSDIPLRVWPPLSSGCSETSRVVEDPTPPQEAPSNKRYGDVLGIWAGCGTSWILIGK